LHASKNGGQRNNDDIEIDRGEEGSKGGIRKSDPLVLRLLHHLSLETKKEILASGTRQRNALKNGIKSFLFVVSTLTLNFLRLN
jgi:hypothetical protein